MRVTFVAGVRSGRQVALISQMTNYELLEYLKLAVQINANSSYVDLIQEEIFSRMEGEEA